MAIGGEVLAPSGSGEQMLERLIAESELVSSTLRQVAASLPDPLAWRAESFADVITAGLVDVFGLEPRG